MQASRSCSGAGLLLHFVSYFLSKKQLLTGNQREFPAFFA
jgi:hypothetical protein